MYSPISDLIVHKPLEHGDPLTAWKLYSLARGDQPTEYLTPRYLVEPNLGEVPFFKRPLTMDAATIREFMGRTFPWDYHIPAAGIAIGEFGHYVEATVHFHRFRSHLISGTVMRMLGASASYSTALDVGCNCGYFTLDLADRGISHVLGVDVRAPNIKQANFLRDLYDFKNVAFSVMNAKDLAQTSKQFDVVLSLGLMYHLSTPYEVMKLCYDFTRNFCVIDTICHKEPFAGYHVVTNKNTASGIEGDLSFELQPTYRGMLDTIKAAGFGHIVEIVAPGNDIDLYGDGTRRCLIAFKADPQPYLARLLS